MAQNVKKVASKNLKKPRVAENSKSCQYSKKLPSNLWLSHSGLKHTLSLIREKLWIVHARTLLRRILRSYVYCRKKKATVGQQKLACLPADRVIPSEPPFNYVGVDCFGSLVVQRARSTTKKYGVLFTCMTVRVIHLEIVHTLDTDSILNPFRRFFARRGKPKQITSDNEGNFIKGQKDLQEAIPQRNQEMVHAFLLQKNMKWISSPSSASHHGGVWEHCIRTVCKVTKALLNKQPLDEESLATILWEVEAIINGRPLTKVSDDPRDPEALALNNLLLLCSGPAPLPGIFPKEDCYSRQTWRHV